MKRRRTSRNQGINWILIFAMILQIFGYYPGLIRAEENRDPVSEKHIWVLPLEDRENITYSKEAIEGYENPFSQVTLEIKNKPQGTLNGDAIDFVFGLSLDEAYQKALNENRKVQFENWKALEENSEKPIELFDLENSQAPVEVTINLGNQFKIAKPEGDIYIKEESPEVVDKSKALPKEKIGDYKIKSNPEDPQKNQLLTLTLKKEGVQGEKALIGEAVVNATLNLTEALPEDVFDVSWDEETLAFTTDLREKQEAPEVSPSPELLQKEPTTENGNDQKQPEESLDQKQPEEPLEEKQPETMLPEEISDLITEKTSAGNYNLPLTGEKNPLLQGEVVTSGKLPFSGLNLVIGQKDGGYAKDDKVPIEFDFVLDDAYLNEVRAAWEEEYEKWIDLGNAPNFQAFFEQLADGELKPMVVSFNLGKELLAPKTTGYDPKIKDKLGNLIATYEFKTDSEGDTVLEITFIKGIYGKTDVSGAAVFDVSLNPNGAGPDDKFDIVWNGTSYEIEVKPYTKPDPPEPEKEDYTLEKTGPANVDKPYIEYEIKAQVNKKDETLKGKSLEDVIPEGLKVLSVELNGKKIEEGDGGYSVADGKLNYTFPANTTETTASFKIKMALTPDAYVELVNNQSWDKLYTNKASLKNAGSTPPLVESKPVETQMKMTFFSKEGKQNPTDGTKIDWVIQIDTSFSRLTNAYLVDVISADHKYDFKNGITITDETGKVTKISEGQIEKINSDIPYENLTLEALNDLTDNNQKNVWYTYPGTDGTEKSIFILSYIFAYQNKNVKVEYKTTIDQEKLEETINDPSRKMDLTNDVKLLWEQFFYGDGLGEEVKPNYVNIKKDPAVGHELLTKSPGNYDEKTQTMHWELKTNVYHIKVTDVVITDTVPIGQKVKEETLKYKKNGQGSEIPLPKGEGSGMPYYKFTENLDGTTTIIITCGDLGETDFYTFGFDTEVIDESVLSHQGDNKINNKGSATGNFNGKEIGNTVEVPKDIKNTLIEKKVLQEYDVTSHDILWKITVNKNHIPVSDMVITDTLPKDTTFGKIEKITKILKNDKNESHDIQSEFTLEKGNPTGGITLTKKDATEDEATYCVYLTSKVDEEWLKKNSKGDFENTAGLQGNVGTSPITDATAKAKTPVQNIALEKRSEDMKDGRIKWTILINEGKAEMGGLKIIEALRKESQALTEISTDKSNFTLYKATLQPNEKFELGDEIKDGTGANEVPWKDAITSLTETGFEFVIPTAVGKETLALEFYSYITENISGGAVKNTVKLEKPGGSGTGDLAEAENIFKSSFDMKQYGTMKGVPLIRLEKQSENGALLTLEGATFDLVAYKKTPGSGDAYVESTHKERVTPENGAIIFVNLQSDVLYKLEEVNSPTGYEITKNEPAYYMFNGTKENKNLQEIDGTLTTIEKEKITFKDISPTTNIGSDEIKNSPTGKISFTKKANDGVTNLEGATFELSRPDGKWNNKKLTTTSDINGKVSFEKLDPGVYSLRETGSPELYSVLNGTLKVTLEADGTYTIVKNETWGSINIKEDTTTGYMVINKYVTGTIKVKKVDKEAPGINLKETQFALYEGTKDITSSDKSIGWSKTEADGIATFNNVSYSPDGYTVIEKTPSIGYEMPTEIDAITRKITGDEIKTAIGTGKGYTIEITDPVENQRIRRNMTLTKKSDSATSSLLKDRVFQLIYKDGDGYKPTKDPRPSQPIQEKDGSWYIEGETDQNGSLTFTNIPYGNYELKEIMVTDDLYKPATYEITKAMFVDAVGGEIAFKKPEGGNSSNTIVNQLKTDSFTIYKTDTAGDNLENVKFTLTGTNKYGETIAPKEGITGNDGLVSFSDLQIGEYTLTESEIGGELDPTKDGYETPKVHKVSVLAHGAGTQIKITEEGPGGVTIVPNNGQYQIKNTPVNGTLQLTKKDRDGRLLQGLEFKLYPKINKVETTTPLSPSAISDKNGVITFNNVPYGNYVLRETAQDGVEALGPMDLGKAEFTVTNNGTTETFGLTTETHLENTLKKAGINLTKKDQNGTLLKEVEFRVERRGTVENNRLESFLLQVPKEVTQYTPYMIPSGEPGGVALVNKTDENGELSFEGLVYGDYKLVETLPAHGMTPMAILFSVDKEGKIINQTTEPNVSFDGEKSYEVKNILESGWVQVNKVFGEQGANTLVNGATLPRGVFEIYEEKDGTAGRFVIQLTTDDKGKFETKDNKMVGLGGTGDPLEWELIPGKYFLKEVKVLNPDQSANSDYQVNPQMHSFEIKNQETTNVVTKDSIFENTPVRGTLLLTKLDQLYKIDENGNLVPKETEQGKPLDGATFMLCLRGTKDIVATMKSNGKLGEYVLSENLPTEIPKGYTLVKTNDLGIPYGYNAEVLKGDYTIVETKPPVGYEDHQKTLDITIGEDEVAVVIDNPMIEQGFKISKTLEVPREDKITEDGTYNQGNKDQRFSFKIERTPESLPTFKFTKTIETDDKGIADFGSLPYGIYTLKETETEAFMTPVIKNITVDAEGVKVENALLPNGQMDVKNALKRGEIKGQKMDVTTPSVTDKKAYPVSGATIGLFKTDKTTKLEEAVTDAQGGYHFKNIPYGEYVIKEIKAPLGYTLGTQEIPVSITKQDQVVEAADIINIRNKGEFSVLKTDQLTGEKLQGAEFTLAGKNAYGDEITPVVVTTGSEGMATFKDISQGTYTLTETRQPNGYVKPVDVYDLVVEAEGSNAPKVTLKLKGSEVAAKNGVYEFKNTQTKITLYKEGENSETEKTTEPLAGAEFGIYTEGDTQCLAPIQKAVSQAPDGKLEFFKIPAGTYQIKEITAPKNFDLNPEGYWITVNSSGDAIEMTEKIVNPAKRGSVTIVKVNESNPSEKVPGSTYGLYKLVSNKGGLFKKGTEEEVLIKEGITDENGRLTFDQLLMDTTYIIRELSAPNGYQISKHPISLRFESQEDGSIKKTLIDSGDNTATLDKDGNLVWSEPPTKVKVLKTDQQGKALAGARFRILDKNKVPVKEVEEWISTQEEHLISGKLIAGETYYLEEIAAPNGYYLGAPIEFKVNKGNVEPGIDFSDKLVFVNEKKPEPPKPIDPANPANPENPVNPEKDQGNSGNTGSKGALTGLTGSTETTTILIVLFFGFVILIALAVRRHVRNK